MCESIARSRSAEKILASHAAMNRRIITQCVERIDRFRQYGVTVATHEFETLRVIARESWTIAVAIETLTEDGL